MQTMGVLKPSQARESLRRLGRAEAEEMSVRLMKCDDGGWALRDTGLAFDELSKHGGMER